MADVKITLKKSLIGCKKPQIATAEALGLHKVGDTTTQPDNAQTEGKIKKIIHLVEVIKGHKGQKARAGHGFRPGFEGGQMPLQRRIPKRGFNNIFAKEIVAINLNALNAFEDGAVVDQAALVEAGIIKSACDGVKVLSNGALTKKVTVKANAFSEAAKAKIEAAGGKAEVI